MLRLFALAFICAGTSVAAQNFDGRYKQTLGADCATVGQDGGALKIEDGVFYGVEGKCEMSNPEPVRGMDAVFYDMTCAGEGESWSERAMLMRSIDGGLIMVWNGVAFKYDSCPTPKSTPVEIVPGTVTPLPKPSAGPEAVPPSEPSQSTPEAAIKS